MSHCLIIKLIFVDVLRCCLLLAKISQAEKIYFVDNEVVPFDLKFSMTLK